MGQNSELRQKLRLSLLIQYNGDLGYAGLRRYFRGKFGVHKSMSNTRCLNIRLIFGRSAESRNKRGRGGEGLQSYYIIVSSYCRKVDRGVK